MSDIEDMFLAFKEEYLKAMQAKAIADRDAEHERHQAHLEMHEMDAWDEFAVEALKHGVGAEHSDLTSRVLTCAAFANELLTQRRKTFG